MSATATISPQCQRVLRALEHGPVTQCAFLPPVCDRDRTISRVGARIHALRHAGYLIESDGRDEHGCAIYKLSSSDARTSGSAGASPGQTPQPQTFPGVDQGSGPITAREANAAALIGVGRTSARRAGDSPPSERAGASSAPKASRPDPEQEMFPRDFGLCRRCELVRAADARRLCEACLGRLADLRDEYQRGDLDDFEEGVDV
ncbi:MAG: helix-turn-helix domain-containing protein [Acidiferrobacteraceae bacterium]